jgi:hypothetical protein
VPGVELQQDSSDRRGVSLNSMLGIASESANAAAEVMLLPSLILAFFVAELTPSYVTIGLVPAVASSLWTLARLPASLITSSNRRHKSWAFGTAIVRAGAVAILAIVTSRTNPASLAQSGRPLLVTTFLCLIVFTLAGGFGSVPGAALLRASVAGDAWDTFVRRRSIWSGVLSLVGAFVVYRLLGAAALDYPGNYGRLFLAATVCLIAVAAFAAAVREPRSTISTQPPVSLSPRVLRQPLLDSRYRRFVFFRSLLSATAAIDPFLFLYAVTRLGTPITTIGAYTLAAVVGWVASAPLWIWLERRSGPRAVLQASAVVRLIAPAIALVLPQILATPPLRERFPDSSLMSTLFGIAFLAIGASLAAQSRVGFSYLSQLAPRPMLWSYTGLTNGILAMVAFSPVLGGVLIQRSGYEALFGVATGIGLVAVFAGGWLADIPTVARDQAQRGRPPFGPSDRTLAIARR